MASSFVKQACQSAETESERKPAGISSSCGDNQSEDFRTMHSCLLFMVHALVTVYMPHFNCEFLTWSDTLD